VFGNILGLLVIGLLAGLLARAVVPDRQPISVRRTSLLGITGAFVGGLLGRVFFGSGDSLLPPSSWIGPILGADIVLMIYLLTNRRSRTDHAVS
jgi:uncharacterized membrane protein YeaQ/YmgE (transglycosylase-associated protein family)